MRISSLLDIDSPLFTIVSVSVSAAVYFGYVETSIIARRLDDP